MLDPYNRHITYLRISVTDRCNLRCRYCMPEEGVDLMAHEDILRFEEIEQLVKLSVDNGVTKIRLTGGEPLVRKGIVELVEMIARIPGVEDLSMTTNGILLDKYASDLKKAGLKRVNISLDTMDAEKYNYITRGGDINKVFKGIDVAQKVGLEPVKINCVVRNSSDEPDALAVKEFCEANNLSIRYIHQMNLEDGTFSKVDGGDGGNCASCNRLRLTADGSFKPCLFNELGYNIKEFGQEKAFQMAIKNKPLAGTRNKSGRFNQIGG
ncbi:GTP 3',8-cyclase MoaA [Carboxylicivirga caseinilyticus]|uniref:GTP 3',8-cyclase MoaA n=1 Tax=Carboxylicivirga caseinilyticus TaxID=3417572 RepID=UPI003D3385EB|nr:radical SAM protein [Marinilabiliaceae bacterium A049]